MATLASYNTLILEFLEHVDVKNAMGLLRLMKANGCKPNEFTYTYTAFIDGLCRNGKLDHAFKVFDEMQQRKTVPNSDTYGSLTYGLSSEGRVDEAKTLIEEMERKGIAPNAAIDTSLIDGYASLNRVNDAFSLLQEMVDRRLRFEPEYSIFRALMKGFTAKNLLDRMLEYGYEPTVDKCTTIVRGLYEDGKTREADDLWTTMEANGLSPNAQRVFTPLITAHSRNLKVDVALDLHDSMIERGLEPDIESCTTLIVALCKMRRVDEAASVYEDLVWVGWDVDTVVWYVFFSNGLIDGVGVDVCMEFIHRIRSDFSIPESEVYVMLVEQRLQVDGESADSIAVNVLKQ